MPVTVKGMWQCVRATFRNVTKYRTKQWKNAIEFRMKNIQRVVLETHDTRTLWLWMCRKRVFKNSQLAHGRRHSTSLAVAEEGGTTLHLTSWICILCQHLCRIFCSGSVEKDCKHVWEFFLPILAHIWTSAIIYLQIALVTARTMDHRFMIFWPLTFFFLYLVSFSSDFEFEDIAIPALPAAPHPLPIEPSIDDALRLYHFVYGEH